MRSGSPEPIRDDDRDNWPTRSGDTDRDQVKGSKKRYHDRGPSRAEDLAMDEISGRLEDAKVGLLVDPEVDGLLAGVDAIET